MQSIAAYLPNVVVAILIFVVAGAIAAAVSGLISRTLGDTATGKIAGAAAPVLIMGVATFMILDQLDIAPAIVEITYIALIGSVALGMAIAFSASAAATWRPACSRRLPPRARAARRAATAFAPA